MQDTTLADSAMSRPRRILMVCPQFRPLLGGYERAAERLSVALAKRGHDVVVVTERRDRSWPRLEEVSGITIQRLWCLHRPGLHKITAALSLFAFLIARGRRFDVIHVHQYGLPAALCVAIGFLLRRPVLLKLSSTGPQGIATRIRPDQRGLRFLHRRLDRCIVTSERAATEAVDFGIPPARVAHIPNGIDTERFRPADDTERSALREELGLGVSPIALYVGRLSAEKDPGLLLDAWSRVAPSLPAQLVVLGDGPERAAVEARAASLGLLESVSLLGTVADPLPYYRAADLLVLSSKNEGLSNSVVEAIAAGLPLASTRVSGCEDIVEASGAGELVDVGDAEGLAVAIRRILSDGGLRTQMGAAAREHAVETYSIDGVADATERLYSDVVA